MFNLNKIIVGAAAVCMCVAAMSACTEEKPQSTPTPTPVATAEPTPTPEAIDSGDVRVEKISLRGNCGAKAKWEFGDDGKLVIYGEGEMNDYEAEDDRRPPWAELEVKSLYINDKITYIGNFSFYNLTELSEVEIPKGVTEIGYDAFDETAWLNNKSEQFVVVGDGVLIKYNGASQDVTIPYGVKYISNAFAENTDESKHAVDISSVKMPDSVIKIGSHAFYSCRFLHEVKFSSKVEYIGPSAFENSGIRSDVVLPESVRLIEDRAFAMCGELYSIKLSENLEYIGDFAFADSGINRFGITANVADIGKNPFLNCSTLKKIEVDEKNEYFTADQNGILYTKDMSELISCPDGIGYNNPVVSNKVKEIRGYAFLGCSKVETVSIPVEVKKIGESAFDGSVIIKAKANSAAHKYAAENGHTYEKI